MIKKRVVDGLHSDHFFRIQVEVIKGMVILNKNNLIFIRNTICRSGFYFGTPRALLFMDDPWESKKKLFLLIK